MTKIAAQFSILPFNVFRFEFPTPYGILQSGKSTPMQTFSQFDRFAALPSGSGAAWSVHPL
jgi:hypothetical protein